MLKKKMISVIFCCVFALCLLNPMASAKENVSVSAHAAVLIRADTGEVLFAKNENEQMAMASTTKIMTALLTLEAAKVDNKMITITDEMVQVEGSSMGLLPGYQLSLSDLAAGMLSVSGNDAANSAAIALSGSLTAFADLMNQRAQELGMKDTHFVTPSGLDDDLHYSTAHDMALLGAAAMQNADFAGIVSQPQIRITYQSPDQSVVYSNHNRLLKLYPDCIGIKTGFTKKAGRCLVSAAERDGIRLIAVTLNAPDDWNDHIALFDYGFSQLITYRPDESGFTCSVPVVGGDGSQAEIAGKVDISDGFVIRNTQAQEVERRVLLPAFLYAPVKEGQLIGQIQYWAGGELQDSVPILAQSTIEAETIQKNIFEQALDSILELFSLK